MTEQLLELEGKNLGCWCKPEACHGDILVKLIDEYKSKESRVDKPIDYTYHKGDPFILFGSNAKPPYHLLSNFTWITDGIVVDGIMYPSVEHAYQAQKFIEKERFSVDGDIGRESGFSLFYPKDKVDDKRTYWMKKIILEF